MGTKPRTTRRKKEKKRKTHVAVLVEGDPCGDGVVRRGDLLVGVPRQAGLGGGGAELLGGLQGRRLRDLSTARRVTKAGTRLISINTQQSGFQGRRCLRNLSNGPVARIHQHTAVRVSSFWSDGIMRYKIQVSGITAHNKGQVWSLLTDRYGGDECSKGI